MTENHLTPAPPADRTTFYRRIHFDLTGLPPTPEAILAFQALPEIGPGNSQTVVDELLESPHYGERYARYWLDVVRYADSSGYELDTLYPHSFLYRDYVIRSFHSDKPFDQFIKEQIAGDELFPDSEEAKLATGFATVGPFAFEGGIARPKVIEYQRLTDLADTTGAAFLGLTVGCVAAMPINTTLSVRRITSGCKRSSPLASRRCSTPKAVWRRS